MEATVGATFSPRRAPYITNKFGEKRGQHADADTGRNRCFNAKPACGSTPPPSLSDPHIPTKHLLYQGRLGGKA